MCVCAERVTVKATLSTKGFDEYFEKLAHEGQDIDAISDEALKAGGPVLVDGMLRRAPELTGELKSHIKMSDPQRDGNYHYIKIGIFDVDREKQTYFFYQEMGTAHTAAHPYIRPTFDEDMRAARAKMLEVFKARGAL
jgi:HK97 gp10 family phage protein